MRKLATAATVLLTAILVATFASAQSVGIGIKKTAPLSGTGSSGSPLKLDVCASGSAYVSNGTSWACAAAPTGDIESVVAGTGLTGGATSGAATVDVGCGTGLSCAADAVTLNMTVANCSAGSFVSTNTATGSWTCTAEVGDISTVTTTANMGLTGGGTSGAVSVGLLSTCADGQVLVAGGTGTTWTCGAAGGSYTAGDGLTLTGSDFDLTYTSDFTITTDQLNLSTAVTAPGSFDVATDLTIGGGQVYFTGLEMDFAYNTNATTSGYINYLGYLHGATQFRNLEIHDGKGAAIATFTGSSKAVALLGAANVTGLVTATAGVTTPANLTTTGTGDIVSADALTVAGNTTLGDAVGDIVDINGDTLKVGNAVDGQFFSQNETIGFLWGTAATATGYINYYGQSGGTTQFRSLGVYDGKGSPIVLFDGPNKHLYYSGAAPTLTGCTTQCSMASYSTDARGRIICTDGSLAATCTVTFAVAYTTNPPSCTLQYENPTADTGATYLPTITAFSTSAFSFKEVVSGVAHGYAYHCDGML